VVTVPPVEDTEEDTSLKGTLAARESQATRAMEHTEVIGVVDQVARDIP
jgi:hypothetical protein